MIAITSTDDAYVTNPGGSSMFLHAVPGIYFYLRMLGVLLYASSKAKKKRFFKEEWIECSLEVIRHLETVDCRFFVAGKKNFIDLESPCVFVANHMSTLETFALGAIIRPHRPVTFVIKESLIRYPLFKHVLKSIEPIVVSRKNPREDFRIMVEQGKEKLSAGVSIVVFPQSVRTPALDPEMFNSIGAKLARKAGVPMVPLALKTDAWGSGWPLKDFGRIRPERLIHFSFGQSMKVEGNGREEHRKVIEFIRGKLEQWSKI